MEFGGNRRQTYDMHGVHWYAWKTRRSREDQRWLPAAVRTTHGPRRGLRHEDCQHDTTEADRDREDIALMNDLLAGGTLQGPVLCSFVMGVRYGYQPAPETVLYARGLLPPDAEFTAGRHRQGVLHDRGAVLSCRRSRSDRSRGCSLSVPR